MTTRRTSRTPRVLALVAILVGSSTIGLSAMSLMARANTTLAPRIDVATTPTPAADFGTSGIQATPAPVITDTDTTIETPVVPATPAAPKTTKPATSAPQSTPAPTATKAPAPVVTKTPAPTATKTPTPTPTKTATPISSGGTYPVPAPTGTVKPWCTLNTRTSDPALWAKCTAGYVAPTIQFGGLTKCEVIASGQYRVYWKWNVVGGNYTSYTWTGASSTGVSSIVVYQNPAALDAVMPGYDDSNARIEMDPMGGYRGVIDLISVPRMPDVVLSTVCK